MDMALNGQRMDLIDGAFHPAAEVPIMAVAM